ncbi:DNA primase [Lentisphaerota bacterium ZTH]|nr:DNA primase [Lentisphaerota bacterium]WET05108.1 DNA primase [Lentisphaerota bacterium ZTH]
MSRAIPDEIIEELRSRCNILELVRSYIPLKKSGSGSWKGLCPFHQEKTPSFTVNEQRGRYHCFGCGRGGDVFSFIMEWEKVDFPNAAHILASKCNVIIPEKTYNSPQERQQAKQRAGRRERLYRINDEFAKWYHGFLSINPNWPVCQYLQTRGIPPDLAEKFQIGAAPDAWDASMNHGIQSGYSQDELLESGIILVNENSRKIYDRFRNRLIFPIWNEQGRVVGFSARSIEQNPQGAKYVNSPETPVFKKSNILYALPLARKAIQENNMAILCEGQLDVIAMHRAGFECSVAPQGTAFTDEQARILKRYTDRMFLAFDRDSAGIKATVRALDILLPLDFEVKIITFPQGSDPDDIFAAEGTDGIAAIVNSAMDMFDFLCQVFFSKYDMTSPHGKGRIISEMMNYLNKISNPVVRESYVQKLSSRLGVRPETVFGELNKLKQADKYKFQRRQPVDSASAMSRQETVDKQYTSETEIPPAIRHAEETLLEIGLAYEDIAGKIAHADLDHDMLSSTILGRALNELINCVLNGEWDHAVNYLTDVERNNPSPELSRILSSESQYKHSKAEKAYEQCLEVIHKHRLEQRKNDIIEKMRNAPPEEKDQLMLELLELSRQAST